MMRYIILLLLLSGTLTAQTKLRQIERSATKWHVPAAWDSIPGVSGHAMKYIDLETLMDTVGIQQFQIDSVTYNNDSLKIWLGAGYYYAIIPQGLSGAGDDGSVAYWHQDTIAGDTAHYWDRTNKRLGLNTKSPTSLLHVKKNEFSLPVAEFDNPGTNGQTVLIKHGASSDARYPLKIQTPASTTYFDARGYLGLGVSPSYPLHVYGSNGISRFENSGANGDAGFDFRNGNKWWRIALNAEGGTTNNVHFRDVTGSRYPITLQSSNGYVGILNLTPARELHVTGRVRVSTLDSDLTPPTTAGPTKMVITDESGDLSFANIPTIPADSTVVTQGYGITVTESPTNTYNVKADTSVMATLYDVTASNQTLSNASTATTHTTTLSNSGGKVVFKEGSNVTLTTSADTVTIASTGGGGGGIDSTVIIGGYGITSVESPLNTFNIVADTTQMQRRIVLTTNGTSGAATLTGSLNLNIPQYGNGDITGITTTAPITGGTTSGNATLGLSYDNTYMGLNGSNQLYPLYNVATWNANALRGRSISITAPTDGQVYAYNLAGNNWVPTTTGAGTVTSVQLAAGTGISLAGTNPITTSGTITVTNSAPNVTTNLSYTNTTSPVTLNSSDGTDVTFTAGSGITLSATGSNMTITSTGGAVTNLSYGQLNTGGATTYGDYILVDNSSGSDVYLHEGDGLDILRSSSNYAGYKLNQTFGQMTRNSGTTTACTTVVTKVTFDSFIANGNITTSTANENITVNATGIYEVTLNLNLNGTSNRKVTVQMYKNNTGGQGFSANQTVNNEEEYVSMTRIFSFTSGDIIDFRINYDNATGTGTDINYYYPIFSIKRLN